ncbi:ABC transporter permease [Luteimonas sp. FXH3W]|uniref:Transport permease protein n=1 Tax=Aquilutibacter rugosus TaxID=3115820 RepID=A0ABU7UYU9_9GAMM
MSEMMFPRPMDVFRPLWERKYLIKQLVKKELSAKYRRSNLGFLWVVLNPVLLMSAYTLVFGVLLRARWGGAGSTLEFALVLQAGLIFYNFFNEVVSRSAGQIHSNQSLVTKMRFPLEVLSWVSVIVASIDFLMSLIVWTVLFVLIKHEFPLGIFGVPVVLIPFAVFTVGISWFVAAAAVFHSDLEHIIPSLMVLLMFVSPLLFPANSMPEQLSFLTQWNPLTYVFEAGRGILLNVQWPSVNVMLFGVLTSLAVAWIGLVSFKGNQLEFADVY